MIARIASLHGSLLFTCLAAAAVLLLVSLVGAWRAAPAGNTTRVVRGILLLLLLAQCVLGGILYLAGVRVARMPLHIIYGLVALATLPVIAALADDTPQRTRRFREALAAVFLIVILLRGLVSVHA